MKKYKNTYGKTSPVLYLSALYPSISLPLGYTFCYIPLPPIATQVLHMV